MGTSYPELALLIASLSLMVSAATFFFGRKDKSTAIVDKLKEELAASQKTALNRIETTLQGRIGQLEAVSSERHAANTMSLTEMREKLARVDETIKQIPNHRDIDQLQGSLSNLSNQISELKGAVGATTRMTERINEFLMQKGGA